MRRMTSVRRASVREPLTTREQQMASFDPDGYSQQSSALSPAASLDRFSYSSAYQQNCLPDGNSLNSSNNNGSFNPGACSATASLLNSLGSGSNNNNNNNNSVNNSNNSNGSNSQGNQTPRIFIANLDYAMKVAEYVPVLRKQLEKHGIEIIDGECYQDKADATGRNRYAVLSVASDEQVRLATSKSNEVKVGYRKVWIYDDAALSPSQRDDILRQLRDQLAKQQAVKIVSGPKPQPPYQHQQPTPQQQQQQQQQQHQHHHHQQQQQQQQLQHQPIDISTPPDDSMHQRHHRSLMAVGAGRSSALMRQSTMIGSSPANISSLAMTTTSTSTASTVTTSTCSANLSSSLDTTAPTSLTLPTVEITPDDDYDLSATSTPPSLFQVITPRSSDTSAYSSGTSPTPPDKQQMMHQQAPQLGSSSSSSSNNNNNNNNSSLLSSSIIVPPSQPSSASIAASNANAAAVTAAAAAAAQTATTTPATCFGARAIVGRRRASAVARLGTPEQDRSLAADQRRRPLVSTSSEPDGDDVMAANDGISLIKTHGEMFLDYVLTTPASLSTVITKQSAVNRFRQLINDVTSTKSFKPDGENASFLFYVMAIVNDLRRTRHDRICFNRQHPQDLPIMLADWNAFLSVQINGAPLELYLRMHPCVTIFRLKASHSAAGNSVPLWHMSLALDCEKWAYASNFWLESSWPSDFITVFQMFVAEIDEQSPGARSVCLERSHFDGIVEDLDELERLGWLHLLGSEFDDGCPRLVGLTLPGYAALWRHAVDRYIHAFSLMSANSLPSNADIDGRRWLCIADLLAIADEAELAGQRPFGLFAFVDGFTFQPQFVLAEQFSFRIAPSELLTTPDVSITCNSQRCAKRRRLAAITDLLTHVPPGTPADESVPFDLELFTNDAFAGCRRFPASAGREDVIRKLPFSFQVSKVSPSIVHVARPDMQDKSGAHLRRLSWLAMCLHAAGTLFFSLDELSVLYSRLFPLPGAGPLLLESLIELCQGPLPILACDSTSAVGLTPLGLAASSIRQALMASAGSTSNGGGLGYASPVSRLVEEWGASVEDVLEVLTTTDPNCGPAWLQMLTIVSSSSSSSPLSSSLSSSGSSPPSTAANNMNMNMNSNSNSNESLVVKLRSLFRQSVSPDVMSFITNNRSSSMINLALGDSNDPNKQADDVDDDYNKLDGRRVPTSASKRRASLPQVSQLLSNITNTGTRYNMMSSKETLIPSCYNLGFATPPKSPPPSSLLLRLGGCLLDDHDSASADVVDSSAGAFFCMPTLMTSDHHQHLLQPSFLSCDLFSSTKHMLNQDINHQF